jgi:transcriptional regulator with PAS, ATPase and Fis domain
LRQDVDYLKMVIESAGLGMRKPLPPALPPSPDDVSEWDKPQDAYNEDPEEQDPEDQDPEVAEPEQMTMKEASLELIEKTLKKHKSKKAAAKELGISERTIYRKIAEIKKKK